MNPYPFEALNHFTVPCAFTSTTSVIGIALPLLVRSPGTPRPVTPWAQAPRLLPARKKGRKVCPWSPSNESKGNTRATNATCKLPQKGGFVHAQAQIGDHLEYTLTYCDYKT